MIYFSLKEFAHATLELRDDVFTEVGNPLVMALDEREIFLLVGLQSFEFSVLPAGLVLSEMSCDVIREEVLQDVELEIVGIVELFALLSLEEVVGAILVAILDNVFLELLLA